MCVIIKKTYTEAIMSIFTRANWRSGLTYRQVCPLCKTVVVYMDDKLDFRPWYPDGFVYCPECTKPLRHNENYAIRPQNGENSSSPQEQSDNASQSAYDASLAIFCTQCGNKFRDGDRFCSQCGTKR